MWQRVQPVSPREDSTEPILEDHAHWSRWGTCVWERHRFPTKSAHKTTPSKQKHPPATMAVFFSFLYIAWHLPWVSRAKKETEREGEAKEERRERRRRKKKPETVWNCPIVISFSLAWVAPMSPGPFPHHLMSLGLIFFLTLLLHSVGWQVGCSLVHLQYIVNLVKWINVCLGVVWSTSLFESPQSRSLIVSLPHSYWTLEGTNHSQCFLGSRASPSSRCQEQRVL